MRTWATTCQVACFRCVLSTTYLKMRMGHMCVCVLYMYNYSCETGVKLGFSCMRNAVVTFATCHRHAALKRCQTFNTRVMAHAKTTARASTKLHHTPTGISRAARTAAKCTEPPTHMRTRPEPTSGGLHPPVQIACMHPQVRKGMPKNNQPNNMPHAHPA